MSGSKDLRDIARKEVLKILKEHKPTPLDPGIERELTKIVKEIERRESQG
jgi:trimethylamine:corrinoid methyltransferase-like protein